MHSGTKSGLKNCSASLIFFYFAQLLSLKFLFKVDPAKAAGAGTWFESTNISAKTTNAFIYDPDLPGSQSVIEKDQGIYVFLQGGMVDNLN